MSSLRLCVILQDVRSHTRLYVHVHVCMCVCVRACVLRRHARRHKEACFAGVGTYMFQINKKSSARPGAHTKKCTVLLYCTLLMCARHLFPGFSFRRLSTLSCLGKKSGCTMFVLPIRTGIRYLKVEIPRTIRCPRTKTFGSEVAEGHIMRWKKKIPPPPPGDALHNNLQRYMDRPGRPIKKYG